MKMSQDGSKSITTLMSGAVCGLIFFPFWDLHKSRCNFQSCRLLKNEPLKVDNEMRSEGN